MRKIWKFGPLISFTILSNSRLFGTLHLSSNVGRNVLGILMISRHLFCIDCNSSARHFGKPSGGKFEKWAYFGTIYIYNNSNSNNNNNYNNK